MASKNDDQKKSSLSGLADDDTSSSSRPNEKSPLITAGTDEIKPSDDDVETAKAKNDTNLTTTDEDRRPSLRKSSITESLREILIQRPRPNACLCLFYFISAAAVIISLCLLATQVVPIITSDPKNNDYLFVALRCYVSGFCIAFILVELRVPLPFLQNNNQSFQNYISRGFLYSFNGLVGLEQAYNVRVEDVVKHASSRYHIGWAPLFMQISAWAMVVLGHVYIVMGLLCMKQLYERLQAEYRARLDEYNNNRAELPINADDDDR